MNRRTDKTPENRMMEQAKRSIVGKNMDLQEAKVEVLRLVDSGLTYRQIAEIPFTVNEGVRRFGLSQISNWVKDRNSPEEEELDEGSLASKAFQLFEEGKGPVQAVVELKIEPEDVEEYYKKWVEMKEQDLSVPSLPKRLKELEAKVSYVPSLIVSQMMEFTDDVPDDSEMWQFFFSIRDLLKLLDGPFNNLYHSFNCECGSKHLVAIKVKCTQCDKETWWGHWPKEK